MDSIYFPVVRWKRAEKQALESLSVSQRHLIQPIIEIVPDYDTDGTPRLPNFAGLYRSLYASCSAMRFYIDCSLLDRRNLFSAHTRRSSYLWKFMRPHPSLFSHRDFIPIPIVHIDSSVHWLESVLEKNKVDGTGLGIRVGIKALGSHEMTNFLIKRLGIRQTSNLNQLDLLLDLGGVDMDYTMITDLIPWRNYWRSIVFIGGSFPKDLSEIEKNTSVRIPRTEWINWSHFNGNQLPVKFGDFTVQFYEYIEPPKGGNVSASIRYACDSDWLIYRGESVRKKGAIQWLAQASLLIERPEFRGTTFSQGDRYIELAAKRFRAGNLSSCGNATTWLSAAINHHLCQTLDQIRNLATSKSRTATTATRGSELELDWPQVMPKKRIPEST